MTNHIINSEKSKNIVSLILFCIYIICVLYITLFSREPTYRRRVLTPLWEYHKFLREDSDYWFQQITCNILMLVPFGVFIGYRFKRIGIIQTAILGALFSSFIEITQYFTRRGLLEFDDVLNNTFGAVIGVVFIKIIILIKDYKDEERFY